MGLIVLDAGDGYHMLVGGPGGSIGTLGSLPHQDLMVSVLALREATSYCAALL
jgi:hypothetical protein